MRPGYFRYTYVAAVLNPIFWGVGFLLLAMLGVL
jgi:hypothetical protein